MTEGSGEERFRLMADAMPHIVWVIDNAGKAEFFNRQWIEYTGVQTEPIPEREILTQCIHPDDREATVGAFRAAQQNETTFEIEHRLRAVDGSYRWFLARAEPYRDPRSGEIVRWFGATTDIHDRRRTDAALRASESKYRLLFDSIDEGFCIIEVLFNAGGQPSDYRFLEVNPAFEVQTGLVDAVGRTMRQMVPEHERSWMETYGRIARSGVPERFEQRADALGRWYEVYAFRIGEPELNRIAVLFNDVRPRKLVEERLRDSETRFRALVTTSSDVVYRMSPDWTEMRQLDGQGFLSDTPGPNLNWLAEYILPDDQPQVRRSIEEAVRMKEMFELEHRVRRADGTLGWTLSRAVPVLDATGEIREWFGAASDVTDRKVAEENLRKSNAELARINRELEEFAYVASHDLQEPLRMVNLYTQLLLRRVVPDNADAQVYTAHIFKGVQRMHLLVRDLLEFSRAVHADSVPAVGTAELSASLMEALSVLRDRVEESGAVVSTGAMPVVCGETKQYAHVFQNLISNALKYRKQDVVPRVEIRAQDGAGEWVISVEDNGIGFDQQYAERIFGLFKRLHTDAYPGTGLGLAICQRIVSRYGGRMWAEGRPGKGATFFFSVPAPRGGCGKVGSVS